jgi:hypothetical protein
VITMGKREIRKLFVFAKFLERKQFRLPQQNLLTSFTVPQPKAKTLQPFTSALLTKSNSNENAKKKEHNADKREVLQTHVIQLQTLQNELESLRAQLATLKGKSSQLASHAQLVQGSRSRERPLRLLYGLPHMPWLGSMFFPVHTIVVSHQNLLLFFALPMSWHKRLMWHPKFLPLGR